MKTFVADVMRKILAALKARFPDTGMMKWSRSLSPREAPTADKVDLTGEGGWGEDDITAMYKWINNSSVAYSNPDEMQQDDVVMYQIEEADEEARSLPRWAEGVITTIDRTGNEPQYYLKLTGAQGIRSTRDLARIRKLDKSKQRVQQPLIDVLEDYREMRKIMMETSTKLTTSDKNKHKQIVQEYEHAIWK